MKGKLEIKNIKIEESVFIHKSDKKNEELSFSIEYFEGLESDRVGKVKITCESINDEKTKKKDKENNYIKVVIIGEFETIEAKFVDYIINAVSVLYPYLRSFITTLTANAGVKPIHIPTINVLELLTDKNNK